MTVTHNLLNKLLRGLIRGYQLFISPGRYPRCRFYPSCSEYAQQSLYEKGILKGGWKALKRIFRCHPWGGSGYDPV